MSDLVKRLRSMDKGWPTVLSAAADRIEELELAVTQLQAEAYKANRRAELADGWRDHDKERADKAEREVERLETELASEKALADQLYEEGVTSSSWGFPCYVSYSKARGL